MKPNAAWFSSPGRIIGAAVLAAATYTGAACHPTPTVVKTSSAAIGETIAGVINGPQDVDLANRTVTAVNVESGQRYETTTGATGSYTLHVPPGRYRLEVQVRPGEQLAPQENPTLVTTAEGAPASGAAAAADSP